MQPMTEAGTFQSFLEQLRSKHPEQTEAQRLQRNADVFNAQARPVDETGYDCPKCKNRGLFMVIIDGSEYMRRCECMQIRASILRMKESGLGEQIQRCRFDTFNAETDWQRAMLDSARRYVSEGIEKGAWFYAGGAVGCGKTHVCTAIVGELLKTRAALYVPWQTAVTQLRANVYDEEEYSDQLNRYKRIPVLYVDDFFKPIEGLKPQPGDLRIAYDLINYRYINKLPTIISSEYYSMELIELDEATGSRIYEKAKGYTVNIKREAGKNYRYRDAEPV